MNYSKKIVSNVIIANKARQFPFSKYNKKLRCIFIHIPKVAGTSVVGALGGDRAKRNHLPWFVYYTANPRFYDSAFKFSFVRNPWGRAFSAYRYLSRGGNQSSDLEVAKMIGRYKSFSDFVISGLGEGHFRNHLLFLPQSDFIIGGNQKPAVDFVGRYENLNEDFSTVLKRLGISAQLQEKNRSGQGADYRKYYDNDKAAQVINEVYKQDILNFGYEF